MDSRLRSGHNRRGLGGAAGVPAASVEGSFDLVESAHLKARGFWDALGTGVVPGLPWRADFGRATGPAPGLGQHNEAVMRDVLGLSAERIAALKADGIFGPPERA